MIRAIIYDSDFAISLQLFGDGKSGSNEALGFTFWLVSKINYLGTQTIFYFGFHPLLFCQHLNTCFPALERNMFRLS